MQIGFAKKSAEVVLRWRVLAFHRAENSNKHIIIHRGPESDAELVFDGTARADCSFELAHRHPKISLKRNNPAVQMIVIFSLQLWQHAYARQRILSYPQPIECAGNLKMRYGGRLGAKSLKH